MGKDAAYSSSAAIFAPKLPAVTRHTAAFTGFTPTNSWNRKGRQPHWNNLNHGLSQNTDSQAVLCCYTKSDWVTSLWAGQVRESSAVAPL